jgi:hypothetical protein
MTQAEWLVCTDPTLMLECLQGRVSNRKLQLFACACCRRLLGLFPNAAIRQAVEFGEYDADDLAGLRDLFQARQAGDAWLDAQSTVDTNSASTHAETSAVRTSQELIQRHPIGRAALAKHTARDAAWTVRYAANDRRAILEAKPADVVRVARATWQAAEAAYTAERQLQATYLRDIVGDPLHCPAVDPVWQRPEVVVFAELIYERRAFERLPELADLLEEVGCADHCLLAHCREPIQHVLGCWAVDLLTGKV